MHDVVQLKKRLNYLKKVWRYISYRILEYFSNPWLTWVSPHHKGKEVYNRKVAQNITIQLESESGERYLYCMYIATSAQNDVYRKNRH